MNVRFRTILSRLSTETEPKKMMRKLLISDLNVVDWAYLATLDLAQFDSPGGKETLAKQLFDAIQNIGQYWKLGLVIT